jgi:hypothetical protein
MRAALLEQLPTAIELLEEGKAVFWSQALELRSTALDLPVADRERLKHLFQLFVQDGDGAATDGMDKVALEQHMERRRQLVEQAQVLIQEIRARPGFDRFLGSRSTRSSHGPLRVTS